MIRIEQVTKKFGKLCALDQVDLALDKGECVALIGPNGCGKTTLIKTVLGMVIPTEGQIEFDGQNINLFLRRGERYPSRGNLAFFSQPFHRSLAAHEIQASGFRRLCFCPLRSTQLYAGGWQSHLYNFALAGAADRYCTIDRGSISRVFPGHCIVDGVWKKSCDNGIFILSSIPAVISSSSCSSFVLPAVATRAASGRNVNRR